VNCKRQALHFPLGGAVSGDRRFIKQDEVTQALHRCRALQVVPFFSDRQRQPLRPEGVSARFMCYGGRVLDSWNDARCIWGGYWWQVRGLEFKTCFPLF
jgi:hypothetical protein